MKPNEVEQAWREKEAKEAQEKSDLIAEFPSEQQAAIARVSMLDSPGGELARVPNPTYRWFNFRPRYIEITVWQVGYNFYLGSDGKLWRNLKQAPVAQGRFELVDLSELLAYKLEWHLSYIKGLGK